MQREKNLIEIIKKNFPEADEFIGDDAALVSLNAADYCFSVDNFVENTHFSSDLFSPYDIGWKSLAVNISDMAAMAAEPLYFLVGLSLSDRISESPEQNSLETWVSEFYRGLYECAKSFGFPKLIGGDLCRAANETSVSITIIGKAIHKAKFLRANAKPGDRICVTGKFGNSGTFLKKYFALKESEASPSQIKSFIDQERKGTESSDIQYHLQPKPRIAEALALEVTRGALMDTSDGLAQALFEIAAQSRVNLEIDTGIIPKDKNVLLFEALFGGEDYELLGCFEAVPENFLQIGVVKNFSESPSVIDSTNGLPLVEDKIYTHF